MEEKVNFWWWLTPLLFGSIPILALYSGNIDEWWVSETLLPFFLTLLLTALVLTASYFLFKTWRKSIFFTSIFIVLTVFFGKLYLFVAEILTLPLPRLLSTILAISILLSIGLLLKKNRIGNQLMQGIFLIACVTWLLLQVKIVPFEIMRFYNFYKLSTYVEGKQDNIGDLIAKTNNAPDFYYFIFDRYARADVLQRYFEFNNSDFLSQLENSGFYIASNSAANYPQTYLSLASSLNLSHLDYLPEVLGKDNVDKAVVFKTHIQNNALVNFFKNRGYRYILLGNSWPPTRDSADAVYTFNLMAGTQDLLLNWYEQTLFNTILGLTTGNYFYAESYNLVRLQANIDFQFNQKINEYVSIESPKFVFGHVMLPHPPYLVNHDCDPVSLERAREDDNKQGYLEQLACANKIMLRLSQEILNRNQPAVIIFQSDEGPYPATVGLPDESENLEEFITSVRIHAPILMAVYADKAEATNGFYSNMSPVSMWTLLLNYYFSSQLPIPRDTVFVPKSVTTPYDLVDVTDLVNQVNLLEDVR